MAKKVIVGGRIESKEVGGIVTGAAEILDDSKGKKQSVINQETDAELQRLDQSKQDNLTFDNVPTEGSDNPVKSAGVYAADKALSDAIEAIMLLIPSAASALNKLVDTAMMNSSISTATATFKGTYNVVTDLELAIDATHEQIAAKLGEEIATADNNDYAFVQVPVSAESTDIRRTERYKFNGTAWGYEYDLNASGFTAAQWAAINSGITLALVAKLSGLPTSSELMALLGQKQDTLTFDNVPTAGSNNPVKSGGVYSAINEEKTAREQLAQTVTGIDGRVGDVEEVIPAGAAANNKLVANSSMEAYVTSIINAITASFTIATADGHINLTLTQTNGRVASLTLTSSDIASAQALTALTGRVSTAEGNITSITGRISTAESDIAALQALYNALQQSAPQVIEPTDTWPVANPSGTVIYRVIDRVNTPPQYYSDYMWNGTSFVLMATYNNAIDPRPKKASKNLVTSGGVFDNMGALDVSELNATENPHTLAQYTDLSAALAAIPTDYQKGGMSIKFVQSSDNKYMQARCMAQNFTTDTTQWQGVDDEPTNESQNLIKSGGVAKYLINTLEINTVAGVIETQLYDFNIVKGLYYKISNLSSEQAFGLKIKDTDNNIINLGTINAGDSIVYKATVDGIAIGAYFSGTDRKFSVYGAAVESIFNHDTRIIDLEKKVYQRLKVNQTRSGAGTVVYNVEIPKDSFIRITNGSSTTVFGITFKNNGTNILQQDFTQGTVIINPESRIDQLSVYFNNTDADMLVEWGLDLLNYCVVDNKEKLCVANLDVNRTLANPMYLNYTYKFRKGQQYRIVNRSANTDLANVKLRVGSTNIQSLPNITALTSYTFIAEEDCNNIYAYFTDKEHYFSVIAAVVQNADEILNDLGYVVLAQGKTQAAGNKGFDVSLKKGENYCLINYSKVTTFGAVKLYKDTTLVQTEAEVPAGGNNYIEFIPLDDITRVVFYANNTDLNFALYRGKVKIDLIKLNSFKSKLDSGDYKGNDSIKALNVNKEIYVKAASKFPSEHSENTTRQIPLVMLTTDIHIASEFGASLEALKRAFDYSDEVPEVAASLMLGDLVQWGISDLPQATANELFTTYNKPIFRILGNHEILEDRTTHLRPTMEQLMSLFFSSDMISHNGDVHPSSGGVSSPWWYYDLTYPTSSYKIRFIGMCPFEDTDVDSYSTYSSEQLQWLCDTLESADENTYIVMLNHWATKSFRRTDIYCNDFTPSEDYWLINYTSHSDAMLADIINAWMYGQSVSVSDSNPEIGYSVEFSHTFTGNKADKFVCWLTGHHHADGVFKDPDYPNQITVILDCTSVTWFQQFNDCIKDANSYSKDSVTLFGFEPFNRRITLIRLGANVTSDMRNRTAVSIKLPEIS